MKTIALGSFLGVNNRLPPFALHVDQKGDYLAAADNVDIDNAGRIRSRRGTALLQAMANPPHSLHMLDATTGYVVVDSVLYPCTVGPSSVVLGTLIKVLSNNATMSYETLAGELYYSNGTDSGRISAGVWYPMGLPTPSEPPLVSIGGGMLAGNYQVSVSYARMSSGTLVEEGGISPSGNIELTTTGGIRVTLPSTVTGATHVNIYLSAANSGIPCLLATVAIGTATYDATALSTGRESNGRFEMPLPAGTLFAHNGMLCSFSGKFIYKGIPYRPGYCLVVDSYVQFPENVSVAISGQTGFYVAADKTYWFPDDAPVIDALPYGAVPGTTFRYPNSSKVGWFGVKGVVIADTQGTVQAVMADNITLVAPASGISAVFEDNGYRRIVSCGWCVNLDTFATTTYSGWNFTSVSGAYGTQADGIYSTNAATPVYATVNLGKLDFDTPQMKHVVNTYLGVDSIDPMGLTVTAGDEVEYVYDARSAIDGLRIQRVDTGKGLRANWFGMVITNPAGSEFTLASVSFSVTTTKRKI